MTQTSTKNIRKKHLLREIIDFVLIVGGVFLLGMIVMNFKAISYEIQYYTQDVTFFAASEDSSAMSISSLNYEKRQPELDATMMMKIPYQHKISHEYKIEDLLADRMSEYAFAFNKLPPGKYAVVPKLDIVAPIVDVKYASEEKKLNADFDEELTAGVVRYPNTKVPGAGMGNSLIFGHSSVDQFKESDNPYGYIFQHLSKLEYGESMKIIWDGQLYTYTVDHKTVVRPDEVGEELEEYKDDSYVTFMACYPLFSNAKRILVRGVLEKATGTTQEKLASQQPTYAN